MANVSSRTRFKELSNVFGHGNSPLLNRLAQLSVLYEDLRIETFAITASHDDIERLDYLDERYRVHYFLRRSVATLQEFRGALIVLSRDAEFKTRKKRALHQDASNAEKAERPLFAVVSQAVRFFHKHSDLLGNLRNAVGGHFSDDAAASATANLTDAVGKLEVTLDNARHGGGPKLHYAGELAATAFVKILPGIKTRDEELKDAVDMIRDGYVQATSAMHALLLLFLWDRFI